MALLGISVGLAAMMIYFSGLISNTILVVAAGYVLLKEEDRWLRAVAAKAILIVCIFGAIAAGITMVENGISGFNYLIMMVDAGPLDRMAVQDLCSFLNYACPVSYTHLNVISQEITTYMNCYCVIHLINMFCTFLLDYYMHCNELTIIVKD